MNLIIRHVYMTFVKKHDVERNFINFLKYTIKVIKYTRFFERNI